MAPARGDHLARRSPIPTTDARRDDLRFEAPKGLRVGVLGQRRVRLVQGSFQRAHHPGGVVGEVDLTPEFRGQAALDQPRPESPGARW